MKCIVYTLYLFRVTVEPANENNETCSLQVREANLVVTLRETQVSVHQLSHLFNHDVLSLD